MSSSNLDLLQKFSDGSIHKINPTTNSDCVSVPVYGNLTNACNSLTRNIGEIFYSLVPINNPSCVLLDGSILSVDGIYSDTITNVLIPLFTTYPVLCVTEEVWQSTVNSKGVCGKFVYDANNRTLRLPRVTGIVEGTDDINTLGSIIEAAIPNTKSWIIVRPLTANGSSGAINGATGAAFLTQKNATYNLSPVTIGNGSAKGDVLTIDPSLQSSVYKQECNTVQPQTIKVFVYMVFGHSIKNNVQINYEMYTNDLQALRTDIITNKDNAFPSDRRIDISVTASGMKFNAPANGYYYAAALSSAANQYITLYDMTSNVTNTSFSVAASNTIRAIIPVKHGNECTFYYTVTSNVSLQFIYATGNI